MNRRRILTSTLTLLALAAGPLSAADAAPPQPGGSALRPAVTPLPQHASGTYDLDRDWRFSLVSTDGAATAGPAYSGVETPGYDDASWRRLDVPHDWSIEQAPAAGPGTTSGTGFLPGGLGWYRKSFTLPPALAGKRLSVEFDGVYMDSAVWFNGRLLGRHAYGYTGFSLDLTGAHTDGRTPNVLAVEVRNRIPSSRWYSGSGIYRHVRLVATDPVRVARLGTFVRTPDLATTIRAGYADVAVTTAVEGPAGTPVRVLSTVRDPRGVTVARAATDTTAGATAATTLRVNRPELWDVTAPNRYTLTTQLVAGGRVTDTYTTPFGIRYAEFDPDRGTFLNGRSIKLQGVDLHHDLGALGAAVNSDALHRQLSIMKSMGVNAVRTSHNPPAPELIAECDRLGLLLMVEAFDVWNVAKVPYDYARFFDANGEADITEMVVEARNAPSVVLWSIGNEIPNSTSASGVPIARRLIDRVRALDPTRPIVIGSDKYRGLPTPGSPAEQILLMLDGVGLNYNTAGSVDALHARYPDTFFFESESASETSTRGVYDQPEQLNTGENHTPGRRGASSFDNNQASWTMSGEYSLKKDRDRPWFLGQFLWSGFDYLGEPTPFDVFPVKASFFGAVDTAGFPKDQYWLFRSQWTDAPMVHLVPQAPSADDTDVTQVWAYANVDTVELFRDGRSLGVRSFDRKTTVDGRPYLETSEVPNDDRTVTAGPHPGSYTSPNGGVGRLHLTWNVPASPGRLTAVARRDGVVVARDTVATAGPATGLRLSADRSALPADGRSLAFLTAAVTDARGTVVGDAQHPVTFSVSGGRLVGVDNGRQESAERYKSPTRTAFAGLALGIVQSGGHAGPVRVTATAPGLRPATITLGGRPARAVGPALSPADGPFVPPVPPAQLSAADASFSGAEDTGPAAMIDGDPATGWDNRYVQEPTALLPEVSAARTRDWVALSGADRTVREVRASFTVDATHALPATIAVSAWDGRRWTPIRDARITWATGSDQPTVVTFGRVRTTRIRLDLASSAPNTPGGFLRITELAVT